MHAGAGENKPVSKDGAREGDPDRSTGRGPHYATGPAEHKPFSPRRREPPPPQLLPLDDTVPILHDSGHETDAQTRGAKTI